jgi:RNA polymerase sigma-70 factor (ECF subfamily)
MDRATPRSAPDDDDRDLLARWCIGHDEQAFTCLVHSHREMVEGVCRRELPQRADADDVVQEVFIALAAEAGSIHGQPGAWLRAVAQHRCLNHHRARQRRRLHEHGAGHRSGRIPTPAGLGEDASLVDACLESLDEDDRALLMRLYFLGHSQAEVARSDHLAPVQIHRRVRRALACLRQALRRCPGADGLPAAGSCRPGAGNAHPSTVSHAEGPRRDGTRSISRPPSSPPTGRLAR